MNAENKSRSENPLPITHNLTPAYTTSLVVAFLLAVVSAGGLVFQADIYPSEELAQSFLANDVVNLIIGVPILLASMWLQRRGKLIGLLFWPGALFFIVYNSLIYVFAMPLNWAYIAYLLLLVLSLYMMIGLVAAIDSGVVQQRLSGHVPERLAGGVLVGFGTIFLLRTISELVNAIVSQTTLSATELGLLIADFLLIPAWIIGGILLWRRQALGYVGGTGLLFQASMLFIGLIVFMLLAPLLTGATFALVDFIIIVIFSLVCLIPFGLFVRGVARANSNVNQNAQTDSTDAGWRTLYKVGGVAALLAVLVFRRNWGAELVQFKGFGIFDVPETTPISAGEWYGLLQESPFVGLSLFGLFDLVNYALLSLLFLALYGALRRTNKSAMVIATASAMVGIAVYMASNQAFAMLNLRKHYLAALNDEDRAMFLAAGEALLAADNPGTIYQGTGMYISLLLVLLAGLITAIVMLQSDVFSKFTAYVGILANGIALSQFFALALAPALLWIPPTFSAPLRILWYVLIALTFFRLGSGKGREEGAADK